MYVRLYLVMSLYLAGSYCGRPSMNYKQNPALDGHRCGVCPTYFQKICAFDFRSNATFIFDNHCIMDMYNCLHGAEFVPLNYDHCLFFGSFAYVHGFKKEDLDYGDDDTIIMDTIKNPDFVRYNTKRKRGRQLNRWSDDIKLTAGPLWLRAAKDRIKWKNLEEAYVSTGHAEYTGLMCNVTDDV